jgi:hypothetical protein
MLTLHVDTVLVIENGLLGRYCEMIHNIFFQLFNKEIDNSSQILGGGSMQASRIYNITSVRQPGMGNRTQVVSVGNVVGGCSAINGIFHQLRVPTLNFYANHGKVWHSIEER